MKTLCILAAGKGSRIVNYSKGHKALLPLNHKAILSHIIDKFPSDTEIIIAVNHNSHLIKQYCSIFHGESNIRFIDVDNIESPCGPGYSLYACKHYLQRPFYLCMSDCLVNDSIPDLDEDWIGLHSNGKIGQDKKSFATADCENGYITKFKNKSKNPCANLYIGLAGIKNYDRFWKELYDNRYSDDNWEQVCAFYDPENLKGLFFNWSDTGTTENYAQTLADLTDNSNDKFTQKKTDIINETTYLYKGICGKLFTDTDKYSKRIYRWGMLKNYTPVPYIISQNMLSYKMLPGKNLYEYFDNGLFTRFLNQAQDMFWLARPKNYEFMNCCHRFYKDKTYQRLNHITISGKIMDYLNNFDFDALCDNSIKSCFHGDAIFSNIINVDKGYNRFIGIDWRESFDNSFYGDVYYDLAKIYLSIHINLDNIFMDNYYNESNMKTFKEFCSNKAYNMEPIKIIASLVLLNIAGLYTHVSTQDFLLSKFLELQNVQV